MTFLKRTVMAAILAASSAATAQAAPARPLVLELFTSQGCSSCPPADVLLKQLAVESSVIALSFHVNYWDYLGWKDPFSSPENTDRQRYYAQTLRQSGLFTPQLVVDGRHSAVGSNQGDVHDAIEAATQEMVSVPVTVKPDADGKTLHVHVATTDAALPQANVFAMRYQRVATTEVKAGENGGRNLSSINNVIEIVKLGTWNNKAGDFQLALHKDAGEGIAILLQAEVEGRILGAQSF